MQYTFNTATSDAPAVQFINQSVCLLRWMMLLDMLEYPLDQMVFKGALYDLMQQVRRQCLMYVGTREVICEWLGDIQT